MTVLELITFLQKQPQELMVVVKAYSEHMAFKEDDIETMELCLPRPDGWVHAYRSDKPTQMCLVFPGN